MLVIMNRDAYKFFCMNSFLQYRRGPDIKAIAIIRLIIAKVKHITKLAGDSTKVGRSMQEHMIIRQATPNERTA